MLLEVSNRSKTVKPYIKDHYNVPENDKEMLNDIDLMKCYSLTTPTKQNKHVKRIFQYPKNKGRLLSCNLPCACPLTFLHVIRDFIFDFLWKTIK